MNVPAPRATALLILAAITLVACGGSDGAVVDSAAPGGQRTVAAGHLVGTAKVGTAVLSADGLLADTGELRLHVYRAAGSGAEDSVQVVANLTTFGGQSSGTGVVIGQACSQPGASRSCGAATSASVVLTSSATPEPRATGEVRLTTAQGVDTWSLELGYWGGAAATSALSLASMQGLYREHLAEFSPGQDTVISLDSAGRLFFQSADTGCIGNGAVSPSTSGKNVYRVSLTIAGCGQSRGSLNSELEGLATFEPAVPWDYGREGPKLWLSTRVGSSPAAALTSFAPPL